MSAPAIEQHQSVKTRAVRGVAWTLPTSLAARAVGLVGTLVLARFLAPLEYGEVSAAAIVVFTVNAVTSFGVGVYLVTNPRAGRAETFHATCWFLGVGAVTLGAIWPLADHFGTWFGAPQLRRYLPLLLVAAGVERLSYVPERMGIRALRFPRIAIARALGELAFTGVSVGLAALGHGAMSIVWGNLARAALKAVLTFPVVGWREWLEPHPLRLATFREVIGFGANVTATSAASFAMRRWDNLLVSRYFGAAAMGAYNYAYNLADTPAVAVGEQISDVVTASFPHLEPEKRIAALRRSCALMSVIMLPMAAGLAAVAPTLVTTFFDARWESVGWMLVVLAAISATRPLALVMIGYLYAAQRRGLVLRLELLSLAGILLGIPTLGRPGLGWTCATVAAVFALRTLGALWLVHRLDGVRVSSVLSPLVRPLAASLAMAAAVLAARPALLGLPPAVRLGCEVAVGATVYVLGAVFFFRETTREIFALARSALGRR